MLTLLMSRKILLTFDRFQIRQGASVNAPKPRIFGLGRRCESSSTYYTSKEPVSQQRITDLTRPPPPPQKGVHPDDAPTTRAQPVDVPSLLWYQRLGPVSRFFGWYDRTQSKRPYVTQLFGSLVVYASYWRSAGAGRRRGTLQWHEDVEAFHNRGAYQCAGL